MKNTNRINRGALLILLATHSICSAAQPLPEPQIQQEVSSIQLDSQVVDVQSDSQAIESTPVYANTDFENLQISPEQLEKVKATLAQMMDSIMTRILQQTGRIEEVLQDLSLATNNNAIGGDNKEKLLDQIKKIRSLVDRIKSEAFVEVEPRTLQYLLAFNEVLMEHVSEAIKKGFKEIPAIDKKLETLHKRSCTISIDTIEDKLSENEKRLAKLKTEAQQIGLRWHHKLLRKVDRLWTIAHHRKLDKLGVLTTVLGIIGAHALMKHSPLGYSKEKEYKEMAAQLDIKKREYNTDDALEACERINLYLNRAEAARTKEQIEGVPFYSKPFRLFRKLVGMPPILEKGTMAEGALASEWNNNEVTWFGKTDLTVKIVGGILISSYFPIIRFIYGDTWSNDLGNWISNRMASIYGQLLGGFAAKQAKAQKEDDESMEPKYTFDDVVGLDHIKAILNNILEYIKDPERFDRANIPPDRGYLFTGLPGTGKSFVAEAFGGEVRKIFKAIGRSEDELGFYSFSAECINKKGIGWLLNLAKKESPCIIFIDEIDLLRLQRGNGNSELLSEFLGSMSGVLSKESGKQVILLAATNRPEHLDRALRRRGRFGKIINFELPTLGERRMFFVKKLDPLLPDLNKIDIDKLAEETEGRTYEELTAMTNAAFQKTKILGQPLTQQHLEDSLDVEIRNIIDKDMNISELEQELIATHQAGHALALELLKPRRKLASVTIKPITAELQDESVYAGYYGDRKQKDIQYGEVFTRCSFDHLDIHTREEKIKGCKVLLSGMLAERILLGACGHSYHTNDKQEALDLVKSLVFEGLHVKTMPKKLQLQYFEKALELLQQCEKETEELLREHEDALRDIVQELQKYKTLSARKVKALIQSAGGESSVGNPAATVA